MTFFVFFYFKNDAITPPLLGLDLDPFVLDGSSWTGVLGTLRAPSAGGRAQLSPPTKMFEENPNRDGSAGTRAMTSFDLLGPQVDHKHQQVVQVIQDQTDPGPE